MRLGNSVIQGIRQQKTSDIRTEISRYITGSSLGQKQELVGCEVNKQAVLMLDQNFPLKAAYKAINILTPA